MAVLTGALSVSEPLPYSRTHGCGLCGAGLEVLFGFTKTLEDPQAARAIVSRLPGTGGAGDPIAASLWLCRALAPTRQVLWH